MEKLICPECDKELDIVDVSTPGFLAWDDNLKGYRYTEPSQQAAPQCSECLAEFPDGFLDEAFTAAGF